MLRTYGWSFAITAVGLTTGYFYGGVNGLVLVAILTVLEVSLSFDNAVVNASIVERMNDFWQRMFLSVGIIIAVFGMRLLFPFVVVAVAAGLGPIEAVALALEKGDPHMPGTYGYILHGAHPAIAAFGGAFLLLLFLRFLLDEREVLWIKWIERPFQRLGGIERMEIVFVLTAVLIAAGAFPEHGATVLASGVLGVLTFVLVNTLGEYFEGTMEGELSKTTKVTGRAAFFLFLYLEVLDASFSFDGVIGAFAITSDPIIIGLGLGVGAMYVRSMTIHLVRAGTLQEYKFLEHGAMWAVGALAVVLLVSIGVEVPEVVTGGLGVALILGGLVSSLVSRRRDAASTAEAPAVEPQRA